MRFLTLGLLQLSSLWISYITADSGKESWRFDDLESWKEGRDDNVYGETIKNIPSFEAQWLKGPGKEMQTFSIDKYIKKLPKSQVFIITDLSYQQNYELRLCYPASTPARTQFFKMTTRRLLKELEKDPKFIDVTALGDGFLNKLKEVNAASSEEKYSYVVFLIAHNNVVLVPYDGNEADIDFIYQIILEPLISNIFVESALYVTYVIIAGLVIAFFFGIPQFRKLIDEDFADSCRPHSD